MINFVKFLCLVLMLAGCAKSKDQLNIMVPGT